MKSWKQLFTILTAAIMALSIIANPYSSSLNTYAQEDEDITTDEQEQETGFDTSDNVTSERPVPTTALEEQLMKTFDQINAELANPLDGFEIESENIDVEGDTLSSTTRALRNETMDLDQLRERLLAGLSGWESRDVVSNDDSLDVTFEKDYSAVTIEGADYIPSSSVTISVTVFPDDGYTAINYDVDITLEELDEVAEEEEIEVEEPESKTKVVIEEEGIEIEIEMVGAVLADGMYDVTFSCASPPLTRTFKGALEVEDGEGEFEAEIELTNGMYSGCELTGADGAVLVTLGSFVIAGEVDEEIEQAREERRIEIVRTVDAKEVHERHMSALPADVGEYQSGTSYVLAAVGAAEDDQGNVEDASVKIDVAVWKSNGAVVIMDVLGGTILIGSGTYTVEIGYALYAINSELLRVNALVTDEQTGDVLNLKLRGSAIEEGVELPKETGISIDLEFEGNSWTHKNELDEWELMLEGTIEAN